MQVVQQPSYMENKVARCDSGTKNPAPNVNVVSQFQVSVSLAFVRFKIHSAKFTIEIRGKENSKIKGLPFRLYHGLAIYLHFFPATVGLLIERLVWDGLTKRVPRQTSLVTLHC